MKNEHYRLGWQALERIRRGEPSSEVAARLVIALAGEASWRSLSDKAMSQLANRINWQAIAVRRAVESTIAAVNDVIANASRDAADDAADEAIKEYIDDDNLNKTIKFVLGPDVPAIAPQD